VFAIIAAVLFGVALLLDLLDVGGFGSALVTAGLLCMALHLALGTPLPGRLGHRP
jgi:hypothetical protein